MNEQESARLARVERKIDILLARRRTKDATQRTRKNEKISRLGNQNKQLKVDKLALLRYIKELEGFLHMKDEEVRQELL